MNRFIRMDQFPTGRQRWRQCYRNLAELPYESREIVDTMSVQRDEQLVEIAGEQFPVEVRNAYAGLLRQQAEGGAAGAKEVCKRIARQLVMLRVTPRMALKFHLATLEEIIATMGPQSAKRVLTCGDVLVLELMSALADAFRQQPAAPVVPPPRRKTWFTSGVN
jgi:hypothetical protein